MANEKDKYYILLDEVQQVASWVPLRSIHDHYKKVILTMDRTIYNDFDGIRIVNIIDFLLE